MRPGKQEPQLLTETKDTEKPFRAQEQSELQLRGQWGELGHRDKGRRCYVGDHPWARILCLHFNPVGGTTLSSLNCLNVV